MITVIMPIYHAESTLSKCVKSILNQTYTDFELILVDDGSPDSSGMLCDQWADIDKRIRVFHQANRGVSGARNRGLKEACGEYICFVDPDDWVKPDYIKCLYDALLDKSGVGLIIQGFERYSERGENLPGLKLENEVLLSENFGEMFTKVAIGYSYAKLFQRDLLLGKNIFFNEKIHCLEDLLFVYEYILHCDYISYGDSQEYVYIKYASSLSIMVNHFDSEYECLLKYKTIIDLFRERYSLSSKLLESAYTPLMIIFRRALKTDYQLNHQVNRKIRLQHLKKLIKENKTLIRIYYHPVYKIDQIGRFLLTSHLWRCYDWWISLIFKLHIKATYLGPR